MTCSQDDWFNAAGSSHYSASLKRIETLCVTRCTRALLELLHPTDGPHPSVEDCYVVFKILTEWSIPAARALVHDGSFDCKVMSARLALSILCSGKGGGEAISSVIENWYRDSSQWKAAFEAAIQIVVSTVIFMLLKLHCVSTGKREQLGKGSCYPTSCNGPATPRAQLSGRSPVSPGVE